ncbi:MAG: RcpC/CpaB family pilus assembly protein, partial [Chloroflexia bacterium]
AGAYLTEEAIQEREIHPSGALPNAPKKKDELVGQVLLLQRAPGDQLTLDMVGTTGGSAYARSLPPTYRAVAVDVTLSTGAMGVLRPGDRVDVVVTWEGSGGMPAGGQGTYSLVAVRDALVLALPSSFRYVEPPTGGEETEVIPARVGATSPSASTRSTVLLAVPGDVLEVLPPYTDTHGVAHPAFMASPVTLLAALNKTATLHLVLRPAEAQELPPEPLSLGDFSRAAADFAADLAAGGRGR